MFFTFIKFFMKILINHAYVVKMVCQASLWFIHNLSKSGNALFRSVLNGNCLFSLASLSLVRDTSLVHEVKVMSAADLYVNPFMTDAVII